MSVNLNLNTNIFMLPSPPGTRHPLPRLVSDPAPVIDYMLFRVHSHRSLARARYCRIGARFPRGQRGVDRAHADVQTETESGSPSSLEDPTRGAPRDSATPGQSSDIEIRSEVFISQFSSHYNSRTCCPYLALC